MTTKKIVVTATDADTFESKLNAVDGFATQVSTCCDADNNIHFTGVIFIRE